MNRVMQDLRYAMRQLRRAPGFATTVVLTLALSVGLATAVFCVVDAVILRPLPFAHPERIANVETYSQSGYNQPASWPSYKDEREQAHSFSALAGYAAHNSTTVDTPASGPVLLDTVRSTGNFFDVFGVPALLGRTYLPGEEDAGKNEVLVLSYDAWQNYFNGDRSILGRGVKLDGRVFTVIGVMPSGFRFPVNRRNAIYTPYLLTQEWMNKRGNHWLQRVGRLRDGVTMEQAQADLNQVLANIGRANPDTDGGRTVKLGDLGRTISARSRGPLWTLLGAVLAVLAIGCVNIAGLLLARGVKREREMAMRVAVGAARTRILRQVLTEGILLAALGAAGAALLASGMLRIMRVFLMKALERGIEVDMNWTVLAAALALAVLASLAASLYPAFRMSGADPNRSLKTGGNSGVERGQHRLRAGFVITQVALTLVLLAVAGMLIRAITRYRHTDLGFDPSHILAVEINLSPAHYEGRDMLVDFYQPLLDRVGHLPGVRAAGVISLLPIKQWGSNSDIHLAGQPPNPINEIRLSESRMVSTGYFEVFGIPLRAGRSLTPSLDRADNNAPTIVVNQQFARKFVPAGLDPIGQHLDDDKNREKWTRIVGVTGSIRQDLYQEPLAEHDYLVDELPPKERQLLSGMWLVVRTESNPTLVVPAIRSAMHEIDPTVPFKSPEVMTDVVSETLVFERMESWLFGIFASLALVLALVGLYGLLSHEVEQSTREIGIRMALGAARGAVLTAIMRRVAWMLAGGIASGIVLTLVLRRLIGVVIYFDAQKEALSVVSVALLLAAAGALASLIPAMRAASIEPMQALRNE